MQDSAITGVILAGGLGRRMGGVDKGLQLLHDTPMVAHVLRRLAPQVGPIMINANQNAERYSQIGVQYDARIVPDVTGGFAGPLAGLQAALTVAETPMVVTVPCDSPFLPLDLVARLSAAAREHRAQIAVARTGDQAHPVFALVSVEVREDLSSFLAQGGRKIDAWYARLPMVEVAFDDEADAFENINTRDELRAFENR